MDNLVIPKDTETVEKLYFLKPVLTFEEGCRYAGISKSKMYKHTSLGTVPFYKPQGKLIYFRTSDLTQWMLQNRSSSTDEISRKVAKEALSA